VAEIQRATKVNIEGTERSFEAIQQADALVKRSGEALSRIVGDTSATAGQVRRIAASAEQQSAAHHHINSAVSEVSEIAQETSLGMVHTAEAIAYLASQAGELKGLIDSMVGGQDALPLDSDTHGNALEASGFGMPRLPM
jgi:methyl-accepting chemotaxis protein